MARVTTSIAGLQLSLMKLFTSFLPPAPAIKLREFMNRYWFAAKCRSAFDHLIGIVADSNVAEGQNSHQTLVTIEHG